MARPPRTRSRLARRTGVVAVLGLLLLLAAPPAVAGQRTQWQVRSFDADIIVNENGSLQVTETIAVSFFVPRPGIYREVPYRVPVDEDTARRYRIDRIKVEASPGASDQLRTSRSGDHLLWRIGAPTGDLTGEHTYVISYRVRGALDRLDTHDELSWNVTGDRWEVPIQRASATVHAPAVEYVRCSAGAPGQRTPCTRATHDVRTATFAAEPLPPGAQLDTLVAIPSGLVNVPAAELESANPVVRAFKVDARRLAGGALVALVGMVPVIVLARRARAARAHTLGTVPSDGTECRPPEGLRPAQLRTLLSTQVDRVGLAATVVDLAVRGHLRVEEAEPGAAGHPDWVVHPQPAPDDGLRPYEHEVLRGLFARKPTPGEAAPVPEDGVTVSSLRDGSFYPHSRRVTDLLNQDLLARGFFKGHPSHARLGYGLFGVAVLLVGLLGILTVFAMDRDVGLVVAPVPVVGLLLVLLCPWAPGRTAEGTALYRRAQEFREFLRTADVERIDATERAQVLVDYLPYAVAFDCVDRWVEAGERLGVASEAFGRWYVGTSTTDLSRTASSVARFAAQVGSGMRASGANGPPLLGATAAGRAQ